MGWFDWVPVMSRVLGGFRPSVVGCVSRAQWVGGRHQILPVGATLASQVCGVLSDECWSGATPRSATFGCSSV
jgi:hypothetical protein